MAYLSKITFLLVFLITDDYKNESLDTIVRSCTFPDKIYLKLHWKFTWKKIKCYDKTVNFSRFLLSFRLKVIDLKKSSKQTVKYG